MAPSKKIIWFENNNLSITKEIEHWKPEISETYFTYTHNDESEWIVKSRTWIGLEDDYFRLFSGAVFKTEQDAKEALSLVYKKPTGREWRG